MNQEQPFSRQDVAALLVGFGLVLSVIIFFAIRSTDSETPDPYSENAAIVNEPELPMISVVEAKKKILSNVPVEIIDIRSDVEYQASHIPGSTSLPGERVAEYVPSEQSTYVLVVPATDEGTTKKAAKILEEKKVRFTIINGGIAAWEQVVGQLVSFGNPTSPTDRSKVTFVSADDFKKAIESETAHFILDVRSGNSFEISHIPKAVNIPLAEIERRRNEIPPATNVALYAGDDMEAFQAAVRLFDLGVFSVKTLETSFADWESKGMPVEKKQ